MKKLILATALIFALTGSAHAAEIPDAIVTQSINGTRQHIRTYTVPPDTDPNSLIEAPFELGNYLYTYASTAKEENRCYNEKPIIQTITANTESDALSDILDALSPTLEYDDGQYRGTLHLDHTSISTESAGYVSQTHTISETITLTSLPSNDMSHIPATTEKDDITLALDEVSWQVQTTSLIGGALIPTTYTATATYSAEVPYTVATGYITTTEYVGTVTSSGVESITYTITYFGSEIAPDTDPSTLSTEKPTHIEQPLILVSMGIGLIAIAVLIAMLVQSRRKAAELQKCIDAVDGAEYEETEDIE